MKFVSPSFVAGAYGVAVAASGIIRFLERPDGEKGFWFGLIMAAFALLACLFFWLNRQTAAWLLIWFCLFVVGGWFVYEALIKKGIAEAEPRMLAIIVITAATATYFLRTCFFAFKSTETKGG